MAKFSGAQARPERVQTRYAVTRSGAPDAASHEGGAAFTRTSKSDLFTLGVQNFVGEDTFYESGRERDVRFSDLVHTVTREDPEWVARFIAWLRSEGNMRSASAVAAAEYLAAGGPNARSVINSALQRADEPGEILGYWLATHGRRMPMALKKGVADAARRLYTEYSALKYGQDSKGVSMVDVLSLTHAKPTDRAQSELFGWLFTRRYSSGNKALVDMSALPMITERGALKDASRDELLANPDSLKAAGLTWEALSSSGPMDARAWEAIIPSMGYMALLRNLRNFDQAGVSDEVAEIVANRLSNPQNVEKSRQLPFRFFSAYRAASASDRWQSALRKALDLSVANVPVLDGGTLVLVDTSASMTSAGYGARSTVAPVDTATLFGSVLAHRNAGNVDLAIFASSSRAVEVRRGESVLQLQRRMSDMIGVVGHGTEIGGSVREQLKSSHRRVFVVTDMQSADRTTVRDDLYVYGCNVGGYATANLAYGHGRKLELPTLTDKSFSLVPLFESGREGRWPWEA